MDEVERLVIKIIIELLNESIKKGTLRRVTKGKPLVEYIGDGDYTVCVIEIDGVLEIRVAIPWVGFLWEVGLIDGYVVLHNRTSIEGFIEAYKSTRRSPLTGIISDFLQ